MRSLITLLFAGAFFGCVAQQVSDTLFRPVFDPPSYPAGTGPVIAIDEAHHNFHTASGRYLPFANVARSDGYRVQPFPTTFSAEHLAGIDVLVIANALHASNEENWDLPNPSAFEEAEIIALKDWVEQGGRLFLIADHMPFAGAAHDLGAAFGFDWSNCFALDERHRNVEEFHSGAGLANDEITANVDTVVTFTGSAFKIPAAASGLVALDDDYSLKEPATAWKFDERTPTQKAGGWYQLARAHRGHGRIVVSGEAAMFSAQLAGPEARPMGMNRPEAKDNVQLLRNILRWLSADLRP